MAGLNWKGDELLARVEKASRMGINRTMALCVAESKESHPFTNRTGTAERSIKIAAGAKSSGGITVGIWGSTLVNYFKYLELGTFMTRGRTSILTRLRGNTGGAANKGANPWKGGSYGPTLIPAAKKLYPTLASHIKWAFAGMA